MIAPLVVLPAEAAFDKRLSNLDKSILLVIGAHAGAKRFKEINRAEMARLADCAESSVPRSVRKLKECGYVECMEQKSPTGKTRPNLYRVKLDQPLDTHIDQDTGIVEDTGITAAAVAAKTPSTNAASLAKPPQPIGGIPVDTGIRDAHAAEPAKENSPDPYKKTTSTSLRSVEVGAPSLDLLAQAKGREPRFAAFDELWAAWRERDLIRRSRKAPSLDAFKAAVKAGADPQRILDGARAYLANPDKHKDRGQFMLGLPKWLGDGEYEEWADEQIGEIVTDGERRRRNAIFQHDGYWDDKWGPRPAKQRDGIAA